MIKQIGLPLRGRPILLITRMITDRIGLHSVLLPLQIVIVSPKTQLVKNHESLSITNESQFKKKKQAVIK